MNFFELSTPMDLFRKMEADLVALEKTGQDAWAVFNFFVTAEHLPDWLNQRQRVQQHAILCFVSHIANGGKHFVIDSGRHHSVTKTEKSRYVEPGYADPGYFYESLLIHLSFFR
jgi:hypothetical protein